MAPVRSAVAFVNGPSEPVSAQELRDRLPAALANGCRLDYLLVPGASAGLACRDAGATDVSYHGFGSSDALDRTYLSAVHARGVTTATGTCAERWPAEQSYASAAGTGRVACYVDRRGAWLLWTDGATLGIAHRSDGRSDLLYASWSSGAYALRNP